MQHSNRISAKSRQETALLMERLLAEANRQGASDAAVSVSYHVGYGVDVRMGSVETIAFSEEKGISIVVYLGQQQGSASSSDTSNEGLRAMVSAAVEIAKVSAPDPCFGLPDAQDICPTYPELALYYPWDYTPDEAIEALKVCEQDALAFDKRLTMSDGLSLSNYAFLSGYAHSRGFSGLVQSTRHSMSISLVAEHQGKMQRDYEFTTARHPSELQSFNHIAMEAAARTINKLGAKKIPTCRCPVLFSSRVSSGLFSSFIQAISGSSLYRKNTFLLDSLGQQIFPQWMTITEDPHCLGALGSHPFDDEGVVTRPNVFVRDGIIQSYVLGTYSARRLGLKTTANAGGVHNLTVHPSGGSFEDVLKTMDRGLLVTELMGQGVNPVTGDYSRGAAGFWVEHGEIQYPVEEVTIAGQLTSMFKQILAVGEDIHPGYATRCGSVLIEEMTVGGSD